MKAWRSRGLRRNGAIWRVETSAGAFEAPKIVNAAGAWADRVAAAAGDPVPLEVIAPMLMITAPVPHFIDPVVILRSRKLSFKQFANGTVMIGGGYRAHPYRDDNRTVIDWRQLADQRQDRVGTISHHAQRDHRARVGGNRGADA